MLSTGCTSQRMKPFLSVSLGLVIFQASEPSEQFHGQNSHTAAHTQSSGPSRSHSRAAHSLGHRHLSSSPTTTPTPQPTQAHGPTEPAARAQVQAQVLHLNGGLDPGIASTLEHIVGQLDILTQVSRICVHLSWQPACTALRCAALRVGTDAHAGFKQKPLRLYNWQAGDFCISHPSSSVSVPMINTSQQSAE